MIMVLLPSLLLSIGIVQMSYPEPLRIGMDSQLLGLRSWWLHNQLGGGFIVLLDLGFLYYKDCCWLSGWQLINQTSHLHCGMAAETKLQQTGVISLVASNHHKIG